MQHCPICSQKNIQKIEQAFDGLCEKCSVIVIAYNRYYASNIPIEYWALEMKDFRGPKGLLDVYESVSNNLGKFYRDGVSVCLSGQNGLGKSMTANCILKIACQKNYSCTYTTLTDIVNALIDNNRYDKFLAQKQLTMSDFLTIDELDPRFIGSDVAADLFGRSLEHIFRTRSQNKLPTIFISNSPNPIEIFSGAIKQSIDSIMSKVKIIPVMGKDFRKENG